MILGIAGKKQSGKSTIANILHGIVLSETEAIQDWNISNGGKLNILTDDKWGEFDISRKDDDFVSYAEHHMWPFIKLYSFADTVKWMCTDLFDVPNECVWGTDEQKHESDG